MAKKAPPGLRTCRSLSQQCCCSREGPFLEGNGSASLLAAWRGSTVLCHPPASPAAPKKGLVRGEEGEPWP